MKKNFVKTTLIAALAISSCGGNSNRVRVHDKQTTASDIKISQLDSSTGDLELRLAYRSNRPNVLNNIECTIGFNEKSTLSFSQQFNLDLGAYSTEILTIKNNPISQTIQQKNDLINYKLNCMLSFDKGKERVIEISTLHAIPNAKNEFR